MGFKNFATCHCHPSSLDSASTPEAFAEREVELGSGVLTVTDHGTLQACRKIYTLAKENSLTPVLGLEGYLRDDNCSILAANGYKKNANGAFVDAPKYSHITIHFLDQAAYECAVRLLSNADARLEETLAKLEAKDRKHGQERKPLFTWQDLEELGAQNTTMTTGCMIGVVQRHLLDKDDLKTATEYFAKLKSIVKPGNLYTELNPHDTSMNWVQGVFLTMADGTKLRWYDKKWLKTNAGEIQAKDLAKVWGKSDHKVLLGVKNYRQWDELPPMEIGDVKYIEDYLPNECRPWAPDGDLQAGLNRVMRHLAAKFGVKVLVGDDSHYATPDEKIVQDVRLSQAGSWRFYGSYHRQSSDEAFEMFSRKLAVKPAEFEGWVENSHEWADRFKDFVFDTPPSLPTKFYEETYALQSWYKADDKHSSLRHTMDLIAKHGRMDWKNPAMVARLKAEIELLHNNGTIDLLPYFMVDEEVCSFFEDQGLLTGPGRGSAAGLILAYLLGITHVDPLKYGLSLERFITKDRIASGGLPDIDQDLPKLRRGLLIDPDTGWLKKRFGDHYAQISVDSTLKLRMAVQDVSRKMRGNVPPELAKLTKKFIMPPQGMTDHEFVLGNDEDGEKYVQGSVEYDPALRAYIKKYPDDWAIVQKCLGLPRQKGRHACAFVIANRPIHEFIPLTTVSEYRVTSYTAKSVEMVGGLKMDFLGIGALDDIGDCIDLIQDTFKDGLTFEDSVINGKRVRAHHLVPIFDDDESYQLYDIWDLPEDQAVFADVAQGKTETVFQFNTPGAIQWLAEFAHKRNDDRYAIDSVEAMSAFTALDRPGALNAHVRKPGYFGPIEKDDPVITDKDAWSGGDGGTYMDHSTKDSKKFAYDPQGTHNMLVEYARRARGEVGSTDILPIFEELLPETYGVMVYQEQLQKMYQSLTGCTGPEAEKFRKLVAKKEHEKIKKLYDPFIEKAGARGGEAQAKAMWQFFVKWAQYGFNKSHSVCYATIGYACAFLKHHYPLQWWTAVLRNASKNEVAEKFWKHVHGLVDLPDVKVSGENFEIQGERVRMPLSMIQGIGDIAAAQLLKYAPYTDIADFCQKIDQHQRATGTYIEKVKTKKVKEAVEGSKKKVTREVEVKELVLKKGNNALNRKVVRACIMTGTMDSLFPAEMHVGEQLNAYEDALAVATGEKRQDVPEDIWNIGPIRRYQVKKGLLPVYSQDLAPLVQGARGCFEESDGQYYMGWTPPNSKTGRLITVAVVGAEQYEQLKTQRLNEDQSITVAVVAYVEAQEHRTYGEDHREMCKFQFDVNGHRHEFVAWPTKESDKVAAVYHQPLKGAVVIAILNRWKDDKPFGLSDLIVVEPPKGQIAKETEDEQPADVG